MQARASRHPACAHGALAAFQPRAIAVFRALQLGDMLCAVPALRALRAALPGARVTLIGLPWAQGFAARFRHYIDDFIAFPGLGGLPEQAPQPERLPAFFAEARARRFDLAIQMHGDGSITNALLLRLGARRTAGFGRPAALPSRSFLEYPRRGPELRRLLRLARFLGAPEQGEALEFPLCAADEAELADFAASQHLRLRDYICVHPGARAAERRWPPARFAAVADALHEEHRVTTVLTGSQQEAELTAAVARAMREPAIDAAAPISIGALALLLKRARLLVSNDTGVSHIAAALQIPSVIVFRASDMERWAPLDPELHRPVWDPGGEQAGEVLRQARQLLAAPRARGSRRGTGECALE